MRVAWVVPGYQGRGDEPGIPTLQGLARGVGVAHDLQVFAVRFPPRVERYRVDGIPVRSFGHARTDSGAPARWAASALRWTQVVEAIAAAHRRAPFALLHAFWATESGMLAAIAGRTLGIPVLVSCCGGEIASVKSIGYGSSLRAVERLQVAATLHLASRIGVGSLDLRNRLLRHFPHLDARTLLLPLSYDPEIFAPTRLAPPVPGRIVCLASWSPVKGHTLLLEALCLLVRRDPEVRLVLIGERTDSAEARECVAAYGLSSQVRHEGAMPQHQVAALLGSAEVAVIVSWHEAQCLAVVEALACGTPVVSTPVGMARELLLDAQIGCCIPARSPVLLAAALRRYLNAPGSPEAAAARLAAVRDLAMPRVAARFLAQYQLLSNS